MALSPEREVALRRRLLAAARALVTYQVGLPHGAKRIAGLLETAQEYGVSVDCSSHPVFSEFEGKIMHLPHGTNRLHWSTEKLMYLDIELEAICAEHRDRLFAACYVIIDELSGR